MISTNKYLHNYTDDEISIMPNVPPDIAGAYLGKRGQYIRCGLQYGRLPFGTAVKNKRWAYHIPGPALVRYKNYGSVAVNCNTTI